jgi:hypothetical protein
MGFFTSQGMKVKLMVCKESKQNEQEMLGNKKFYKNAKTSNFSTRKTSFSFGIFLRFHAKTYEKRLLPSY